MSLSCPKSIINTIKNNCHVCGCENSIEVNRSKIFDFSINVCEKCGSIYRSEWMDKESFLRFGRRFHRSFPNQGYYQKEIITAYTINKLIEFDPNDRVLVVNSGIGVMTRNINAKSIICLELAKSHYEFAKRTQSIPDFRNDVSCKDSNFDVVIIWDYIQFIPNPVSYLREIREKMTEKGILVISCPIIDQPSQDFLMSGIADQYSSFYTLNTLRNLISSAGFKIDTEYSQLKNPAFICSKGNTDIRLIPSDESLYEIKRYIKICDLLYTGNLDDIKKLNKKINACYFKFKFDSPESIDHVKIQEELAEADENLPNYIPVVGLIAQYYYTIKQYDKAEGLFRFITDFTCDASVAKLFSVCLYDMGIFDESLSWLKTAIELTPPESEIIDKIAANVMAMIDIDSL